MPTKEDPRVDLARGRTMREVLEKLPPIEGLRPVSGELTGPCPKCGGTDRFSISERQNVYNCRSCGGGDPIALVMLVLDLSFIEAVEFLEGEREAEIDPAELERRRRRQEETRRRAEEQQARYRAAARRDAVGIWRAAQPFRGTLAEAYLNLRVPGFQELPMPFKCFRFLPDYPYVKKIASQYRTLHRGPVLISAVQGADGKLQAVHRTWIDLSAPKGKARILHPETGEVLAAKTVRGSQKGGAIRLTGSACTSALVMGEGIETTLTALVAGATLGASYWAGISLGNMAGKRSGGRFSDEPKLDDLDAFLPPVCVDRLIFIQDGDSDPRQTRAQLTAGLRRAMNANPALTGLVVPAREGGDLNDMICTGQDEQ